MNVGLRGSFNMIKFFGEEMARKKEVQLLILDQIYLL